MPILDYYRTNLGNQMNFKLHEVDVSGSPDEAWENVNAVLDSISKQESEPDAKIEKSKPVAEVAESKSVAEVEESKPVTEVEESKSAAKNEESKPAPGVEESKSAAEVDESKPGAEVEESKSVHFPESDEKPQSNTEILQGAVCYLSEEIQQLHHKHHHHHSMIDPDHQGDQEHHKHHHHSQKSSCDTAGTSMNISVCKSMIETGGEHQEDHIHHEHHHHHHHYNTDGVHPSPPPHAPPPPPLSELASHPPPAEGNAAPPVGSVQRSLAQGISPKVPEQTDSQEAQAQESAPTVITASLVKQTMDTVKEQKFYIVTTDLTELKREWYEAELGELDDEEFQSYLGRKVKSVDVEEDDDTVNVCFDGNWTDTQWFPVGCLYQSV